VAEVSIYVARASRGQGVGREATEAIIAAAEAAGFWKLVSRVFPENTASRRLLRSTGFREVGLYRRHALLEGTWRDWGHRRASAGRATGDGSAPPALTRRSRVVGFSVGPVYRLGDR
jgi:L-amino acid N-acyltransferase YncA